jgi:glutaredoxin 2
LKLYHYVHCPFCIRVRMGLGLLRIPFESHVLPYNDEKTPVDLTGVKMLPILVDDQGQARNESLDILKHFDVNNNLSWPVYDTHKTEVDELINTIGTPVHSLCMPYWIWTPEFDAESRIYFQKKKEVKRGPFKNLIHNKKKYIDDLNRIIEEQIEPALEPFYKSSTLTIADIMIASHLWGMYIFPEYQFDPGIHQYLQEVKKATHFDYHQDFWK